MGVRSASAGSGEGIIGLQCFDGCEICLREPGRMGSGLQLFDGCEICLCIFWGSESRVAIL